MDDQTQPCSLWFLSRQGELRHGENHAAGPQVTDNLCATCHIPEGELEFDASIKGAHTIPRFSRDLPGVKFEIMEVKNTRPGQKPTVTLKITDKSGFPIETSQMSSLSLVIAGPNTDYAAYWSENVLTRRATTALSTTRSRAAFRRMPRVASPSRSRDTATSLYSPARPER